MNTRTFAHKNRALWIGPALVVGVLLMIALGVLWLAHDGARTAASDAPVASMRIPESFAEFKQRQAMQVADAAMVLPVTPIVIPESFTEFKQRQAMQVADAAMIIP